MAHDQAQVNINVPSEKTEAVKTEPRNEAIGTKTTTIEEKKSQKSVLLPDTQDITKLNIDDNLLDQIYEQAHTQAINTYHDAKLSIFTIQVFPFQRIGANVTIYLDFYSKWADKTCTFRYSDFQPQVEHSTPDKRAKSDYDRKVFENMPWKESPQWMQFLKRVYVKITPISPSTKTYYHLTARAYSQEAPWKVTFEDGFSGEEHPYVWNGKGLDEDSIKRVN